MLPFVLPYHQRPLLSFQAEWLALSLGVAAILVALIDLSLSRDLRVVSVPQAAVWLLAYAALIAIQGASRIPPYISVPLLGIAYLAFAALLIWLGAQLTTSCGTERTVTVLAGFILVGALANAAAAVIQFHGRPVWLEDLVADLSSDRAYGNIAQANLFANYIALGQAALLFMWARGFLRTALALAAALLLVYASALSGSRTPLLFAAWFCALAGLATRMPASINKRPLHRGCVGMAAAIAITVFAVPIANAVLGHALQNGSMVDRIASAGADPRWKAWELGFRMISDSPLLGRGFGGFAGAAFEAGLPADMTRYGEVWTSPHNLVIGVLAETGILGAILVIGGLGIWWWRTMRSYLAVPRLEPWWAISVAGVAMLHSFIEFPLSSAHFLGLTALAMGIGSVRNSAAPKAARAIRLSAIAGCLLLASGLAVTLRDYVRLESTYVTGASLTLAGKSDVRRDAQIMRELAQGPLAQPAEMQIFLGFPLQPTQTATALPMSARVMHYWPSHAVVLRRAIFLAFAGSQAQAQDLLRKAMRTFPGRCREGLALLEDAAAHDRTAIEPLLVMARSGRAECR